MKTSQIIYDTNSQLNGEIDVPGDKSISHRSLIFSALANGESVIIGLLEGEDVLRTAQALKDMGVDISKDVKNNCWKVKGSGLAGLMPPKNYLDMGNSGTSARLLMGLVSSFNFKSFFKGDASLSKRPMKRVFDPLRKMGAEIEAIDDNNLPALITGKNQLMPINYEMPVASAQLKSSILLASLNTSGTTTIIEPVKCRNHTELMMEALGLNIKCQDIEINGKIGTKITFNGNQEFLSSTFKVPGDISSAAFIIVATLICSKSSVKINNVGINSLRDGIIRTLIEMGGDIKLTNKRKQSGEDVCDILVKSSKLKGIEIPSSRAPSMIDEYPILSIAAANAEGLTIMKGIEELKVKESNRLFAINEGLNKCGVKTKMGDDYLEISGGITQPNDIVKIKSYMDHRIAMSFLIMGLKIVKGIEIDDVSMINTSFPNFNKTLKKLGINI